MDTRKFGAYISKLRKEKDLTQSQLADLLNVTRQAVSKWEMGDSFPDIALLPHLADIFHVTVDQILNYGEPSREENRMMHHILKGMPEKVAEMLENQELRADSVVHVAPLLKASTLGVISEGFEQLFTRCTHSLSGFFKIWFINRSGCTGRGVRRRYIEAAA